MKQTRGMHGKERRGGLLGGSCVMHAYLPGVQHAALMGLRPFVHATFTSLLGTLDAGMCT